MTMWHDFLGTTSRICYAADDGTGNGGETADGKDKGGGDAAPKWATELQETMKGVGLGISELVGLAKGSMQRQPVQTEEEEEEEEEEKDEQVDLESLSRAEYAQVITKKIIDAVNKQVVKPLSNEIKKVSTNAQQSELQRQVQEAANEKDDEGNLKRPDFWEWKEAMIALATQHPSLSAKQLYRMAREDDPDKLKKLEEKYKIGGKKGDGDGSPGKIKLSFGGFTPNGPSGGRKSGDKKLSPKEAAESAWDETVKSMGGEPVLGEE